MPATALVNPALVLRILPSGERYFRVSLLSPDRGILHAMQRRSAKADSPRLDLFDTLEAQVELRADGSAGFLREALCLSRRGGIGTSYEALDAASRLSKLALANPPHEEQAEELFALVERALDALDAGAPPSSVLIKTLFVYCRDEGYPIREEWARSLPPSEARAARAVLNAPLREIDCPESDQRALLSSMQDYIVQNTHLRLDW